MYRTAILGAFLLIGAPLAPMDIPAFFDGRLVRAELGDLVDGIQGLSAAQIHTYPSQREVLIQGLLLRRPNFSLRIGRLALRLTAAPSFFAGASFMQAAAATDSKATAKDATAAARAQTGMITADDITIETDTLHAAIKHIDMKGTQLSKADLAALFDPHAPTSAAARLAKISAAHVVIPEIVLTSKPTAQEAHAKAPPTLDNKIDGKPDNQTDDVSWAEKIVLRDIAMDDVVHGRARLAMIGATSAVIRAGDAGKMQTAFGPTRVTGLDLAQAARLLPAAGKIGARQKLCNSLDVEGVKISAPKAELGFGTVAIKNVEAGSLQSLLQSGNRLTADRPPRAPATAFAQFLANLALGSLEFTDLRFAITSGATPWSGGISRGFLTKVEAAKIDKAGFEDVAVASQGAKMKIGHLAWQRHDAKAAPAKTTGNKPVADASGTPLDQQQITADALDLDIANLASYPVTAGSPTRFQLSHFELTSRTSSDGMPTRMKADFDHLIFNVGAMKDGTFAELATLGYNKVDLSSRFEANFNNENNEFYVDVLSLSGTDMGAVKISGRFDHVTKALFSSDQTDIEAGLLSLLLHRIEIRVENTGFFERSLTAAAKKDNMTPAAIRKKFTDAVTSSIPTLLNNGRGTDAIVAALTKFIAQPKTFRLSVTAPQGIGALEMILIKNPATLLQKVEVEAAADE